MTVHNHFVSGLHGKKSAAALALSCGVVGLLVDSDFWSPALIVVSLVLALGSTFAVILS